MIYQLQVQHSQLTQHTGDVVHASPTLRKTGAGRVAADWIERSMQCIPEREREEHEVDLDK